MLAPDLQRHKRAEESRVKDPMSLQATMYLQGPLRQHPDPLHQ